MSGQDRKFPPAPGTNQIAGFREFRPLTSQEKNKITYLFRNAIKVGGHRPRFRDKACGKQSDFDKLVHVIQHGLHGLQVKISKITQRRQNILILLCISESVASIISKIAIIFTNINP